MRDVWLLLAVLGAAVWAGMTGNGAPPAADHAMPAAMAGMGEMGGMTMGAGEVSPSGAAPAAKAGEAGGDACCPTGTEEGHDCSKHEGQPCDQHAEPAASTGGELSPEQMQMGVCPMGGAEAATEAAPAAPATEAAPH